MVHGNGVDFIMIVKVVIESSIVFGLMSLFLNELTLKNYPIRS